MPQSAQHVRPFGSSWSEKQVTAGAVLDAGFLQENPSRNFRGPIRPVLLRTKRDPDERASRNVRSDACSPEIRSDRQGGSQTAHLQFRMVSFPRHRRQFGPKRLRIGKDPVEHAPLADRE